MTVVDYKTQDLIAQARAWAEMDPDPSTRAEATVLTTRAEAGDRHAVEKLHAAFGSRLTFGTSGLRARLGAGPARMNRVVVIQTAAALAQYLREAGASLTGPSAIHTTRRSADMPVVVIGFDARANSDVFARDTAEIMAGAQVRAVLLPGPVPTPVLAFAVRELDADAGVMITASHNPVGDNGYKVYLGGVHRGAQIASPVDAEIARRIDAVAKSVPVTALPRGDAELAPTDILDAYVARTAALVPEPLFRPRVAYTALHGVGGETFRRVLRQAGYATPIPVTEQDEPDGSFPTAAIPNPEEPGALDRVFALAHEIGAELVLAHDPDADRLAVGVPVPSTTGGAPVFRRLTGNEVGLALAWWACDHASRAGRTEGSIACSVVSTPALESLGTSFGYPVIRTLSGFKWIARVPHLIFGFEEALGYLVNPETLHDKDGISAGLAVLALVGDLHAAGLTLLDKVTELTQTHGAFVSSQLSMRTDAARIAEKMAALRKSAPASIGGSAIVSVDDYARGFNRLPATNLLAWHLANGSRVMLRPSGTEAKLKVYVDATSPEALEHIDADVRALFAAS
jgi:phosphomannomutase